MMIMIRNNFLIVLVAATCISAHLYAQEAISTGVSNIPESSATVNTSRSNIKNNSAKEVAANSNQCLFSLISNAGGCEITFVNEVKSPRDAASGLATGKRSPNPFSFIVSSADNSVSEVKSPRDVSTGQSSGRSPGNPIGGLTIKGGKNPGGNQFNNLVVKNGQIALPSDCPNGDCDLVLSWSWGASNSGSSKTYCQCHFILTMQDGACVAIKTKGTGASNK
jgi:hypothetical protein